MPGSSSTWRHRDNFPHTWTAAPRPEGLVPVAGDRVTRYGSYDGKTIEMAGKLTEVYARKAAVCRTFRWVARITWTDGSESQVRIEHLTKNGDGWVHCAEGRVVWS